MSFAFAFSLCVCVYILCACKKWEMDQNLMKINDGGTKSLHSTGSANRQPLRAVCPGPACGRAFIHSITRIELFLGPGWVLGAG